MNLGQYIGELRSRIADLEAGSPAPERQRLEPREKKPTKEKVILSALRGRSITLSELHAVIGGSRGALSVYIATLKSAGKIISSGEKYHYRYSLP